MMHHLPMLPQKGSEVQPAGNVAATEEARWARVLARDRTADGAFVYAVTSTRVFCRPSCPSRRPSRDRVRFFDTPLAAEASGFRPCRRCRPTAARADERSGASIRRVAAYLRAHATESVPLAALARLGGLSRSHLQRQFKRVLGVSPREFQAACRADRFRRALRSGRDVAGAIYEAGYGSPSRIYEAPPTGRGLSPSAYRRGGAGQQVGYTIVPCELGRLLVGATPAGVCAVKLGGSDQPLVAELSRELPAAVLVRDTIVDPAWVTAVVERIAGVAGDGELPLDVRGTAFQWRVWRALQRIPSGETRSYGDIARAIGRPTAARAVARACAANPVAIIVPCHRVVGADGTLGGYRWGVSRKRSLLDRERSRRDEDGASTKGSRQ